MDWENTFSRTTRSGLKIQAQFAAWSASNRGSGTLYAFVEFWNERQNGKTKMRVDFHNVGSAYVFDGERWIASTPPNLGRNRFFFHNGEEFYVDKVRLTSTEPQATNDFDFSSSALVNPWTIDFTMTFLGFSPAPSMRFPSPVQEADKYLGKLANRFEENPVGRLLGSLVVESAHHIFLGDGANLLCRAIFSDGQIYPNLPTPFDREREMAVVKGKFLIYPTTDGDKILMGIPIPQNLVPWVPEIVKFEVEKSPWAYRDWCLERGWTEQAERIERGQERGSY